MKNISDEISNILFDRVFDPIALYRIEDGKIIYEDVNPAYERVMKVSRDEIAGQTFHEVWPDAEAVWSQVIIECLEQKRTMHCIGESVDTDSYLEAIAFPISTNMAAVIFLDRTKRRKSDEALRRRQRQLQTLAAQLTISEENTRRMIASDLHDRVGYDLVKILHVARRMNNPELQEIIDLTEKIIAENRSLIFELSPPVLKEAGLNPALEELAKSILEPANIAWQLIAKGSEEADDEVCVILYRSARELLINAVKHSGASEVNIIVNSKQEIITVAVEDNGKGFADCEGVCSTDRDGFGLFSVRERLLALGGELRIISESGKGAMLIMSCPRKLEGGELIDKDSDSR